jgi:hypothetical protein
MLIIEVAVFVWHDFSFICNVSIALFDKDELFTDKQKSHKVNWTEVMHFLNYIVCQYCRRTIYFCLLHFLLFAAIVLPSEWFMN